jgi:L-lysine 2,3-aminomutase
MTITIKLDKENEIFIKEQATINKLSITEYLINLAKIDKNKQNIKKDVVEMFQELSSVKE